MNTTFPRRTPPRPDIERILKSVFTGLFCWPIEALTAMIGLRVLHSQGFQLPTPGYWSSFIVVFGFDMLRLAFMLTRSVLDEPT